MVNISLTPNPFPLLITWDNRFRTVGKENMSQENMLAGSQELPLGVWLTQAGFSQTEGERQLPEGTAMGQMPFLSA